MSEQNKATVRRIYEEVFGQGKLDVADELLAPDAIDHEGEGGTGPQAVKDVVGMFRAAFPDLQVTIDDIMADGDKVASRARFMGTHKGEFQGIPATGKRIEVEVIDIIRFGADGKAVEHWGLTDNMLMMQQLGVVPEMGS